MRSTTSGTSQAIVPKLVCFILCCFLLTLAADQGLSQEAKPGEKPREEKQQPSIFDKIIERAGEVIGQDSREPLPKDFEATAKRDYDQIADPEVTFPQYLELRKQEFLRKNQQQEISPIAGSSVREASTISGQVLDNHRRPVGKVTISLKGKVVAESGDDGSFSFSLPKAETRVAVTFAAEGYVSNTRVYDSKAQARGIVVIWPIAYRVKFDPSRELDITLGTSRIQVPANVLTSRSGEKPRGQAVLQFTLFDVTNPFERAAASGDFSGQLPDGRLQRLNSYGIFDFDLRDLQGDSLSLTRGAKINLSIPVPPRLVKRAPRQVGYFVFDTLSGVWIPAGAFNFVPGTLTYNGTVERFGGSHNLDDEQDTTCVTIQVISGPTGAAMPFFHVSAEGLQYSSTGTTDTSGFVCLLVARNSTVSVTAIGTSLGGTTMGTPTPLTITSPDFSSGAGACGDPTLCPFLGTVSVEYIVGLGRQVAPLPF